MSTLRIIALLLTLESFGILAYVLWSIERIASLKALAKDALATVYMFTYQDRILKNKDKLKIRIELDDINKEYSLGNDTYADIIKRLESQKK